MSSGVNFSGTNIASFRNYSRSSEIFLESGVILLVIEEEEEVAAVLEL
jgi:hypothetical protein